MKRILALATASALALTLLVGCDKKGEGGTSSKSNSPSNDTLVVYTARSESLNNAVIENFEADTGIHVDVVTGGTGEVLKRVKSESANPQGDICWAADESMLKDYAEYFEPYVSHEDEKMLDNYKNKSGVSAPAFCDPTVFIVNTDLAGDIEINGFEDLLNPALKGKIIFSDPNSSSAAWNNLSNIMAVFGTDSDEAWAYIEKLMPNLVIAGSSSACFKSVQQGEYVVGLTYEDGAVNLVKDGADNIRLQYPAEGTSATAFGCALVKNGPNPENAKAMIDFLCSADGQTALAAYQEGTLRYTNANYEVPENAWLTPSSEIKWVDRDVQYMTENKDAILEHWNDLYASVVG